MILFHKQSVIQLGSLILAFLGAVSAATTTTTTTKTTSTSTTATDMGGSAPGRELSFDKHPELVESLRAAKGSLEQLHSANWLGPAMLSVDLSEVFDLTTENVAFVQAMKAALFADLSTKPIGTDNHKGSPWLNSVFLTEPMVAAAFITHLDWRMLAVTSSNQDASIYDPINQQLMDLRADFMALLSRYLPCVYEWSIRCVVSAFLRARFSLHDRLSAMITLSDHLEQPDALWQLDFFQRNSSPEYVHLSAIVQYLTHFMYGEVLLRDGGQDLQGEKYHALEWLILTLHNTRSTLPRSTQILRHSLLNPLGARLVNCFRRGDLEFWFSLFSGEKTTVFDPMNELALQVLQLPENGTPNREDSGPPIKMVESSVFGGSSPSNLSMDTFGLSVLTDADAVQILNDSIPSEFRYIAAAHPMPLLLNLSDKQVYQLLVTNVLKPSAPMCSYEDAFQDAQSLDTVSQPLLDGADLQAFAQFKDVESCPRQFMQLLRRSLQLMILRTKALSLQKTLQSAPLKVQARIKGLEAQDPEDIGVVLKRLTEPNLLLIMSPPVQCFLADYFVLKINTRLCKLKVEGDPNKDSWLSELIIGREFLLRYMRIVGLNADPFLRRTIESTLKSHEERISPVENLMLGQLGDKATTATSHLLRRMGWKRFDLMKNVIIMKTDFGEELWDMKQPLEDVVVHAFTLKRKLQTGFGSTVLGYILCNTISMECTNWVNCRQDLLTELSRGHHCKHHGISFPFEHNIAMLINSLACLKGHIGKKGSNTLQLSKLAPTLHPKAFSILLERLTPSERRRLFASHPAVSVKRGFSNHFPIQPVQGILKYLSTSPELDPTSNDDLSASLGSMTKLVMNLLECYHDVPSARDLTVPGVSANVVFKCLFPYVAISATLEPNASPLHVASLTQCVFPHSCTVNDIVMNSDDPQALASIQTGSFESKTTLFGQVCHCNCRCPLRAVDEEPAPTEQETEADAHPEAIHIQAFMIASTPKLIPKSSGTDDPMLRQYLQVEKILKQQKFSGSTSPSAKSTTPKLPSLKSPSTNQRSKTVVSQKAESTPKRSEARKPTGTSAAKTIEPSTPKVEEQPKIGTEKGQEAGEAKVQPSAPEIKPKRIAVRGFNFDNSGLAAPYSIARASDVCRDIRDNHATMDFALHPDFLGHLTGDKTDVTKFGDCSLINSPESSTIFGDDSAFWEPVSRTFKLVFDKADRDVKSILDDSSIPTDLRNKIAARLVYSVRRLHGTADNSDGSTSEWLFPVHWVSSSDDVGIFNGELFLTCSRKLSNQLRAIVEYRKVLKSRPNYIIPSTIVKKPAAEKFQAYKEASEKDYKKEAKSDYKKDKVVVKDKESDRVREKAVSKDKKPEELKKTVEYDEKDKAPKPETRSPTPDERSLPKKISLDYATEGKPALETKEKQTHVEKRMPNVKESSKSVRNRATAAAVSSLATSATPRLPTTSTSDTFLVVDLKTQRPFMLSPLAKEKTQTTVPSKPASPSSGSPQSAANTLTTTTTTSQLSSKHAVAGARQETQPPPSPKESTSQPAVKIPPRSPTDSKVKPAMGWSLISGKPDDSSPENSPLPSSKEPSPASKSPSSAGKTPSVVSSDSPSRFNLEAKEFVMPSSPRSAPFLKTQSYSPERMGTHQSTKQLKRPKPAPQNLKNPPTTRYYPSGPPPQFVYQRDYFGDIVAVPLNQSYQQAAPAPNTPTSLNESLENKEEAKYPTVTIDMPPHSIPTQAWHPNALQGFDASKCLQKFHSGNDVVKAQVRVINHLTHSQLLPSLWGSLVALPDVFVALDLEFTSALYPEELHNDDASNLHWFANHSDIYQLGVCPFLVTSDYLDAAPFTLEASSAMVKEFHLSSHMVLKHFFDEPSHERRQSTGNYGISNYLGRRLNLDHLQALFLMPQGNRVYVFHNGLKDAIMLLKWAMPQRLQQYLAQLRSTSDWIVNTADLDAEKLGLAYEHSALMRVLRTLLADIGIQRFYDTRLLYARLKGVQKYSSLAQLRDSVLLKRTYSPSSSPYNMSGSPTNVTSMTNKSNSSNSDSASQTSSSEKSSPANATPEQDEDNLHTSGYDALLTAALMAELLKDPSVQEHMAALENCFYLTDAQLSLHSQ